MILLDDNIICPTNFPDGTLALRVDVSSKDNCKMLIWNYEADSEMSVLYYITKHLKNAGFTVSLYMPYIPNARMDRVKNSDEIFTLKYFAELINSLGFESVYVRDPHSSVSCALFNNLKIDDGFQYIMSAIDKIGDEDLVVYYPDDGAKKKYSEMITNRPYTFGVKDRDWRSGNIRGIILQNEDVVKGKNVLIVDDICSKGGTFYHSAKALKAAGANDIYLYVTHCENTILKGELLTSGLIEKVYTTNSIFTKEHEKIEVLEL